MLYIIKYFFTKWLKKWCPIDLGDQHPSKHRDFQLIQTTDCLNPPLAPFWYFFYNLIFDWVSFRGATSYCVFELVDYSQLLGQNNTIYNSSIIFIVKLLLIFMYSLIILFIIILHIIFRKYYIFYINEIIVFISYILFIL